MLLDTPDGTRHRRTIVCGAEALWCAVIEQALSDLKSPKHREQALRWFEAPEKDTGSFLWVCEQVDIEPGKIQQHAHKLAGTKQEDM